MINKKKKGEMSTEQIVLLIILLVSFAIILFFLFRLNLGKTTDQETCHNSVVARSSNVIPKETIPLNCKTQYVCISKDGTCEAMTSPQIEKVKTKDEVYSILANQMADCWWMFGEGKLNYVSPDFQEKLYCSICSQISFDNSVNFFSNNEIDQKDFYAYLSKTNVSGKGMSYLEYITKIKSLSSAQLKMNETNMPISFQKISLSKQYYVMMGIINKVSVSKWIAAGVGVGIAIVTAGGSIPTTVAILGAATAGGATGYFVGTTIQGDSGQYFLTPIVVEANSEAVGFLKCEEIKTVA